MSARGLILPGSQLTLPDSYQPSCTQLLTHPILTGVEGGAARWDRTYTYDTASRLATVNDTTFDTTGGKTGCQTRGYGLDPNGNRTSQTITNNSVDTDGKCQTDANDNNLWMAANVIAGPVAAKVIPTGGLVNMFRK